MNAHKPTPLVTRQSLQAMIVDAQRAKDNARLSRIIGRALVALHERQTKHEQRSNDTEEANGEGFASSDAKDGSITAKSYLKHGTLQQWQLDLWTRPWRGNYARICKYARQLNEIALQKRP